MSPHSSCPSHSSAGETGVRARKQKQKSECMTGSGAALLSPSKPQETPAAYFHSVNYTIDTPITSFVRDSGSFLWTFSRMHLSNQV